MTNHHIKVKYTEFFDYFIQFDEMVEGNVLLMLFRHNLYCIHIYSDTLNVDQ